MIENIGCLALERYILPKEATSPRSRLVNGGEGPEIMDVTADYIGEISPIVRYLYINITEDDALSGSCWQAITSHRYHVRLYTTNFKLDPGQPDLPGYQEVAVYPISYHILDPGMYTYVRFEKRLRAVVAHTYSLRPMQVGPFSEEVER